MYQKQKLQENPNKMKINMKRFSLSLLGIKILFVIIGQLKNQEFLDIQKKNSLQNMQKLDLPGKQSEDDLRVSNYQAQYKREDQMKLIQRSINMSFLAITNPKKKTNEKHQQSHQKPQLKNLLKSKIMEKARIFRTNVRATSHILDEEEINQSFSCQLNVKAHSKQQVSFLSWCCDGPKITRVYQCSLTQIQENTMTIKEKISNKPEFILNFNTVDAIIQKSPEKAQPAIILKVGNGFSLQFSCPNKSSQKDLSKWGKMLEKRIDRSIGKLFKIKDLQSLDNEEKFYQLNYKLEREFVSQCQTGDILLFQSNHFMAKAQRLATGSDFDHVGIIIRDPVYDILLYESNGNTGVCLTPWKLIIQKKWYQNVSIIVWRKLEGIKRDYDFIQQFHGFVMANMQRKYHISFDKLTIKTSFVPQSKEQEGFFCSQLVARVYKRLELIPTAENQQNYKPACNYLPFNFTQKANLKLLKGWLSPQYRILFNEAVIQQDYVKQ